MRRVKKAMQILLAGLLVSAMAFSLPMPAKAADQTQYGSEGIVKYDHEGLDGDQKRVSKWEGGGNYSAADGSVYEIVANPGRPYQYVYCINHSRSASARERFNANFRWRWNASANRWLLDNSRRHLTNPDNSLGAQAYDMLVKVLYAGYPYNAAKLEPEPNYEDTQHAIFRIYEGTYSGGVGTAGGAERIIEAANTLDIPSHTMYMYLADTDAKQLLQDTIGLTVWEESKPQEEPKGQRVSVGFAARKLINGASQGFDSDRSKAQFGFRLEYVNDSGEVESGQWHTRAIPGDTDDADLGYVFFGEVSFGEEDLGEHKYRVREIHPSEGVKYWAINPDTGRREVEVPLPYSTEGMTYDDTVYEITLTVSKSGDVLVVTHNGRDVTGGVIDAGTFDNRTEEPKEGKLSTTVKGASDDEPLELTAGDDGTVTVDITDTIAYSDLTGGAVYTVTGTIVEKESGEPAAPSVSAEMTADASGSGEWEITFKGVTLEAGKTYVVFEEAVNKNNPDDKAEHKDKEDTAQTIVVKEKLPGEVTIKISKRNLGGEEIKGAKITVSGAEGYSKTWTSDGKGAKELTLLPGEYEMQETVAPKGYRQITTKIAFTVDADGNVTLQTAAVDNGGEISVMDANHIVLKDAPTEEPPEEPEDEPEDEPEEPEDEPEEEPEDEEPDGDEEEDSDAVVPIVKVLHYTVHVGGNKFWNDNQNEAQMRPESITMTLYGDGEAVDTRTVTGAGDTWVFDFGDRPMYKAGEPIRYTVVETEVEYYTSQVSSTYNKTEEETGSELTFAVTNDYSGPVPDQLGAGRRGDRLGAARNTGDNSHALLWLFMMTAAVIGFGAAVKRIRAKQH